MHVHTNTFKATRDIAAGQEILIKYGNADWFEGKNLSHAAVDYASTMWRPDLNPLPYRRKIAQRWVDGRHSYAVLDATKPGSILEISICVEVSVVVVDQFSYLWDFVLTGETENEHTGCQHSSATSRAHTGCFFADQGELNIGERANQVLFSFLYSLFSNDQTRNDPKPSRPCDLRLGSLVRMDLKREHMHLIKS